MKRDYLINLSRKHHLRPCPFCQNEMAGYKWVEVCCAKQTVWKWERGVYFVFCPECKATGPVAATEDDAEQLWNNRAGR